MNDHDPMRFAEGFQVDFDEPRKCPLPRWLRLTVFCAAVALVWWWR